MVAKVELAIAYLIALPVAIAMWLYLKIQEIRDAW